MPHFLEWSQNDFKCVEVGESNICSDVLDSESSENEVDILSDFPTPRPLYSEAEENDSDNLPYSCNKCDSQFILKKNFLRHGKQHIKENLLSCPQCPFKFTTKRGLKIHLTVSHKIAKSITESTQPEPTLKQTDDLKPFKCVDCSKSFNCFTFLERHMLIHIGEKPFSCKICWHAFSDISNLNKHLRLHKGNLPFSCEVCNYRSNEQSKINRHRKSNQHKKKVKELDASIQAVT